MKIIIKVGKDHFVAGLVPAIPSGLAVKFTRKEEEAQVFKSNAEVNRWLDQHVNVGEGLNWGQDIKLRKWA